MTPFEQQEFYRIARRLTEKDAYLNKTGAEFGLMVRKNKWQKPVMCVDKKMVITFHREQLLQKSETREMYALSDLGHAKYNRREAGALGYVAQHDGLLPSAVGAALNLSSHPLKSLYAKTKKSAINFTDAEFKSAERINCDYEISLQQTNLCVDWSRPISGSSSGGGSSKAELPDRVMDAHKRLEHAFDYVGSELADILRLVCCEQYGLEAAEKKLQWPRRSAKLALKFSLSRLAKHYGY